MPAIVTDRLKKEIILNLIKDAENKTDNAYYIGIGRPTQWNENDDTTPTPINYSHAIRDAQYNLIAVKRVNDYSFVIPRQSANWTNGSRYEAWSDKIREHSFPNPFYVITDANGVFVCLQQGRDETGSVNVSTVQPANFTGMPFHTGSDGYIWKFLYTVGPGRARLFLSGNYIPVTQFSRGDPNDPEDQRNQFIVQEAAVPGQIIGYELLTGGSGYTSTPTVEVVGDGTGAAARAIIPTSDDPQPVSNIVVAGPDTDAPNKSWGMNYTRASVKITGGGGSGAKARAIIGPAAGIGADPRDDLKARAVMFTAAPEGNEGGDFPTGNDFRQVLLIKNIRPANNANTIFKDETGNALRSMTIGPVTGGQFTLDSRIVGETSGATAHIARIDLPRLYYIQDSDTGFDAFGMENVREEDGQASAQITDPLMKGEVDVETGEVIYIDNRTSAVSRENDQTEDIKIIIDL